MEIQLNGTPRYGLLMHEKDLAVHKRYFNEMCHLIGINVVYFEPKPDKHWTSYAEIESNYYPPIIIGCIFNEHPDQRTMKKLGWASELQGDASIISAPYDLKGLQVGALFAVPDVYDSRRGRLFRVTELSGIMLAPASITCKLVPEYEDT